MACECVGGLELSGRQSNRLILQRAAHLCYSTASISVQLANPVSAPIGAHAEGGRRVLASELITRIGTDHAFL